MTGHGDKKCDEGGQDFFLIVLSLMDNPLARIRTPVPCEFSDKPRINIKRVRPCLTRWDLD